MINFEIIAAVILAYLLGSIPSAVWAGKIFHGIDIRTVGSGNAGATNTIRILGLKTGIPVLLFDILKAYVAVMLAHKLNHGSFTENQFAVYQIILGSVAVIGHVFPVFAGFKGGKGVASLVGVVIALYPLPFLVILGCFTLTMILTGIVSVSSMVSAILFPFIAIFMFGENKPPLIILAIAIAIFIPLTHKANIKRLLAGTEKKFDFGKNRINKH